MVKFALSAFVSTSKRSKITSIFLHRPCSWLLTSVCRAMAASTLTGISLSSTRSCLTSSTAFLSTSSSWKRSGLKQCSTQHDCQNTAETDAQINTPGHVSSVRPQCFQISENSTDDVCDDPPGVSVWITVHQYYSSLTSTEWTSHSGTQNRTEPHSCDGAIRTMSVLLCDKYGISSAAMWRHMLKTLQHKCNLPANGNYLAKRHNYLPVL